METKYLAFKLDEDLSEFDDLFGGGGGKGGSGVFIVRYLTSIFNTSSSGGTKHTYGNYTVHTFTENGTLVLNNP